MSASGGGAAGRPQGVRTATLTLLATAALAATLQGVARVAEAAGAERTAAATARLPPLPASLPGFRADLAYLPDDAGLGFVLVPEGAFRMGSDPAADPLAFDNERWADGRGTAEVDLPAFLVSRTEVTVAQFRAFVAATGHAAAPEALAGPADHPVASVTWTDALAYARWLDGVLRASPATPEEIAQRLAEGWRVTLPTEAQWEKAARGTDGRVWPWGGEPRAALANFAGEGTTPVGSRVCAECAWGLADMAGNVWEWTRTPYRPGPYVAGDAPVDLGADALWVMRGGSFADGPQNVRAAVRGGADPSVRRPNIGFRVVLTR